MNYSTIRISRGNYSVIEKPTRLTIASTMTKKDATRLCHSLNAGGGFDGYTPLFVAGRERNVDLFS